MLRMFIATGQKNVYFKETKVSPLTAAITAYKYFIRNGAANCPRRVSVNCWDLNSTTLGFQCVNMHTGVINAVGTANNAAKKTIDVKGGSKPMKPTCTMPASILAVSQPKTARACTMAATELSTNSIIISGVDVDFTPLAVFGVVLEPCISKI